MEDKTLLKISLIVALVGIVVLYVISQRIQISESEIDKITMGNVGEMVKVNGKIIKYADADSVVFLTVSQPSTIDVVVFKKENVTFVEGSDVEIIGKIEEYNGKLEIIAQRIRTI